MALLQRIKPPFAQSAVEEEAASLAGPRSAGDILRQRREALGWDLGQIATSLKIKPGYLAALEEGRPDRLPGPAYAAGFVRAYGEHLGLDGSEVLRRFRVESAGLDAKPDLSFPMPLGERGIPGRAMLWTALLLALCGYGTWYYLANSERSRPERVTEVPVDLLPPKPMPAAASPAPNAVVEAVPNQVPVAANPPIQPAQANAGDRQQPVEATTTPQPPPPAIGLAEPAAASAAVVAATAPASGVSATAAKPTAAEETGGYGVTDGRARIVLRATTDSWIAIRDADQGVLFSHLLKPGETYRVPDRSGISMRTGNAGGLEITVDGKPAPPIGGMGAVRRNVALDPQALLAGTAVRD